MRMIHKIAKAAAIALTAACAISAHAQDVIKIGYTADQSASGVAELGIAGRWGFEAAIEDLNKAGGILGRKGWVWCVMTSARPPRPFKTSPN